MDRIEKLLGKGKTITLNGVELDIKPMTVDDIDILMEMGEPNKLPSAMKKLVKRVLERTLPEATEEQRNQVSFEYFPKLIETIMEINHLDQGGSSKLAKYAAQKKALQDTK